MMPAPMTAVSTPGHSPIHLGWWTNVENRGGFRYAARDGASPTWGPRLEQRPYG
jgi:hypothetical protein